MEETIQAGYGEAVGEHTNRAAGFCALLGMVLLLNQGGTGAEGMARDEQEIARVESSDLANQIKGGGLSGQNEILKDAETLVLKMLPLQDRGEGNLRLSEAIPEPSLRLPELSDGGTVWEAVQEQTDRMPGDRTADFSMSGGSACQTEPGISGAGEGNELLRQAAPGDTADAGMEMNPARLGKGQQPRSRWCRSPFRMSEILWSRWYRKCLRIPEILWNRSCRKYLLISKAA